MALPRKTREEVLASKDLQEIEVDVPQWGTSVLIRAFTLEQLDEMQKASTGPNPGKIGRPVELDNEEFQARLFVAGVVDPKFNLDDYEALRKEHSAVALSVVMKALLRANGLSEEAVDEAAKSPEQELDAPLRIPVGARARRDDARGTTGANVRE